MGKMMEAIFCVLYLAVTGIWGTQIVKRSEKNSVYKWFGIMCLILVCGDAFHLIPRIAAALDRAGDYSYSMGIGKMVTSITMTIFYMILYSFYERYFDMKKPALRICMIVLAALRILLCLLPQNDWTGADPLIWGIYRNIPFTVMGLIIVVLFYGQKKDRYFSRLWLAVLLSFAFYIPVVLGSDVSPMIGMLMMPKTCMYMWIVWMGRKAALSAG